MKLNVGMKNREINQILITLLIILTVWFPADIYNLKTIVLGVILLLNIGVIIKCRKLYFLYSIILLVYLAGMSIANTFDVVATLKATHIILYLWVIPVIKYYNIDFKNMFLKTLLSLAIFICIVAIFDFFGIINIGDNAIIEFFNSTNNAQISKSINAMFVYVVFMNASPLLYFLLINSLVEGDICQAGISFLALMLSGTRANIYMGILILVIYMIFIKRVSLLKIISIGMMLAVSFFLIEYFLLKVDVINLAKSQGDITRNDKIVSSLYCIMDNPKNFLFGMGAGTTFKSVNTLKEYSAIECSYVEFWRIYGLIGLCLLILLLVLVYRNLGIENKIAYLCYLVVCWVDPFLFTSTGFIMLDYLYVTKWSGKYAVDRRTDNERNRIEGNARD